MVLVANYTEHHLLLILNSNTTGEEKRCGIFEQHQLFLINKSIELNLQFANTTLPGLGVSTSLLVRETSSTANSSVKQRTKHTPHAGSHDGKYISKQTKQLV